MVHTEGFLLWSIHGLIIKLNRIEMVSGGTIGGNDDKLKRQILDTYKTQIEK